MGEGLVANESGKLNIYDLATMQNIEQFVFTGSVTLVEFSEDGKKLIVLTSNQTAHVFDISSL
jgi:WD40 repeat protein